MSTKLTTSQRLYTFSKLRQILANPDQDLTALINSAQQKNPWFTPLNVHKAIDGIVAMLNEDDLQEWFSQWAHLADKGEQKKVGLILAGNIPMVGFHDLLCVLAAGHIALIKLSSQDQDLIKYITNKLIELEPAFAEQIQYIDRLQGFDVVIATGSNNSSRYFDYYFASVPHIIRKNRNSVAVLTGQETPEEIQALGQDIFTYFGLGCRNVSKVFLPQGFNPGFLYEPLEAFASITDHYKYVNNYDYNKSIYLVNGDQHYDNGFLLLKQDERLSSPLAVLYYEEYTSLDSVINSLSMQTDQIQCIASATPLDLPNQVVPLGGTQSPKLWDYADGFNTMDFLLNKQS